MREIKISKPELENYYWKKNLSSRQIAEIYNCDKTTIVNKMKKYGIRLRHQNRKSYVPRLSIKEKDLKKLYNTKKFSIQEIAQIYNCCPWTVWMRMKECGIKARDKKIYLPKHKIKDLYINQKLTATKIANTYHCSRPTIVKRIKEGGIKLRSHSEDVTIYERKEFSNDHLEKAYLIGFRLGDLHVYKPSKNGELLIVRGGTTRNEQAELFNNLFRKYGHINKCYRGEDDCLKIEFYALLNNSFNFLLSKKDNIEDWILKKDKYFFAFLAGYFDAEGNVHTSKRRKSETSMRIESCDKEILHKVWLKLNSVDIKCPKPKICIRPQKRHTWSLRVSSHSSVIKLLDVLLLYLKHRRKIKEAKTVLRNTKGYAKFYKVK